MQPTDLFQRFQAAVGAGAGNLTGSTAPGIADLLATLSVDRLAFTQGAAGLESDAAWLTGATTFLGTAYALRLSGKDASDPEHSEWSRFTLQLTPAAPTGGGSTTLGGLFGSLPKSWGVPEGSSGMEFIPSVVAPLPVRQAMLVVVNEPGGTAPPARLQGQLMLSGTRLDYLQPFLGGASLPLDGTVDFTGVPAGQPTALNLIASGTGAISAGGLALRPIGLQIRTDWPNPDRIPGAPDPSEPALLSAVLAYCRASVAGLPVTELTAPLLSGDYVWKIVADFGDGVGLGGGLAAISSIFNITADAPGETAFALPPGLSVIDALKLRRVSFGVRPTPITIAPFTLAHICVDVSLNTSWDTPLAFVRLDEVGVRWLYFPGSALPLPFGSIWGRLALGGKKEGSTGAQSVLTPLGSANAVTMFADVTLPEMEVRALLESPLSIKTSDFFGYYYSGTTPTIGNDGNQLTIRKFEIFASVFDKHYLAEIEIDNIWSFRAGFVTFSFEQITFRVETLSSRVSGQLAAVTSVKADNGAEFRMQASAAYPGGGSWTFRAQLIGTVSVSGFVSALTGRSPPSWLPSIEIAVFDATYGTGEGKPFDISGLLEVAWPTSVLGAEVKVVVGGNVRRRVVGSSHRDRALALTLGATEDDVSTVTEGMLIFTLTINRFEVSGSISVADGEKTYMFSIAWGDVKLIAATRYIGKDAARHQVLSVRMEGVTLGSIVEYLVNLANPNANYRLDPPWDFLNAIDLSRFELVIDKQLETITLTYAVDIDLAFASLTSVGLVYDRKSGEGSVRFIVQGSMLGKDYKDADALQWDAVKDNPPALPGKGQALFDLKYLGVGQHVTPKSIHGRFKSIGEVIDTLRTEMVAVDGPGDLPVGGGAGQPIAFDPASQWLLGLDCTIMETVTLKLLLHDPDLYGVLIALGGEQAQALAGLSIELYYRKVTATVGVFHCRLQIPDAFRQLQFGAVAVTLGVITLDIFTNGNFKVDLGFPHDRDFTDSFAVEVGIFNGHGGLYFGLLDGATSDRVPRISNGTFSPVLELGVGLMVGAGRTFEKGPLSAGVYVDVVVIFEGVLGWFHPSDTGASSALYYWARGTAGIVGKLYGSIDFKIISVSVSVEASAFVTATIEAHRPTEIALDVDVDVEASVHFLFVTVHFHFGLRFSTSFTIGSASSTPWQLAAGEGVRSQRALARGAYAPVRGRGAAQLVAAHAAFRGARRGAAAEAGDDVWWLQFRADAGIFPSGVIRPVALKVTPAFTVANPPIQWRGAPAPPPVTPDYRIAFLLSAETPVPPDAQTIEQSRRQSVAFNAQAETPDEMPFPVLAEAVFRWTLDAAGLRLPPDPSLPSPRVTRGALHEILRQLRLPQASSLGFTAANLDGFFEHNLRVTLSGTPAGAPPAAISLAPFPVFPGLKWTWSDPSQPLEQSRDFSTWRPVGAHYEADVVDYFSDLDPRPAAHQPSSADRLANAPAEATESLASFVFRDYFLMIARAAVQAAADRLDAWPHIVTLADSLQSIAGGRETVDAHWTGAAGDTHETIAAALGLSRAELEALNPGFTPPAAGETAFVALGVTVEAVAECAADWPVTRGLTLDLGDLTAQVQPAETLDLIATRWLIADSAPWLASAALRAARGLLRPGATLPLTNFTYANPQSLSLEVAAAVLYVRKQGGSLTEEQAPLADWYAGAIVQLGCYASDNSLLPSFHVPRAAYDQTRPMTWTRLPGDTLPEVAAALSLVQNIVPGSAFDIWLQQLRGANTPPATAIRMPAGATAVVAPNDTLDALAERLFFAPPDPDFAALVRGVDLLQPLAEIPIHGARMTTLAVDDPAPDRTLLATAQAAGLPLEDFAVRVQTIAGLLKPPDPDPPKPLKPLIIRDVPALDLNSMAAALHEPEPAAAISGQVSRFMLHGLRLPTPIQEGGVWRARPPMAGLYDLVGQQLAGPAPSAAPAATIRFSLSMSKSKPADWLHFAESRVIEAGETLAAVAARHGALHALNPALAARDGAVLPEGMIVLTDPAEAITVSVTEGELSANYPATTIAPAWSGAGLQPLPLSRLVPVHHPITQMMRWRTTVTPQLPQTATAGATPSLWLLPGELVATAGAGISAHAYDLMQRPGQAAPTDPSQSVAAWAWGTMIDIAVQRIPGAAGTLEVHGADTADRQRLAQLLAYLGKLPGDDSILPPRPGDGVTLIPAWSLPPGPGAPSGLTTAACKPSASFLIKTNLSTETHSGNPLGQVSDGLLTAGDYFASFAGGDLPQLLTLFWECSVVGGGGYWLRLVDAKDKPLVPEAAFDQDGRAVLSLLVQLGSQSEPGTPVRKLYRFNNVAVIGDGVDPGSVALFASAADGLETRRQATVRPGEIGFTLDLKRPAPPKPDTPELRAERLYSLLGYKLADQPNEGQPLAPQVKRDPAGQPLADIWNLMRVIPIDRFRPSRLPAVTGLPPPAGDPYAGVNPPTDPAAPQKASTTLWFHDLLGNTTSSANHTTLDLPITYTDPLMAPGSWPATSLSFDMAGNGAAAASIVARVSLQGAILQPSGVETGAFAAARAARQQERFARAWYQIAQPSVTATVSTTLCRGTDGQPRPLAVPIGPLRGFAAGAYVLSGTLATLGSLVARAADLGSAPTPATVTAGYGVDYDSLGAANADVQVSALFTAGNLDVPKFALGDANKSVAQLCAGTGADAETVLKSALNGVLPLQPGVAVAVPNTTYVVPAPVAPETETPTLIALLQTMRCTLEDFAAQNAGVASLLTPGAAFLCNGFTIAVALDPPDSEASLNGVKQAFKDRHQLDVSVTDLLAANSDVPNLFRPGAPLVRTTYIAVRGDTLAANETGATQATLAPLNTGTIGLFPVGTPIYLLSENQPTQPLGLAEFARQKGIPSGDLFSFNPAAPLADGVVLLPGRYAWPPDPSGLVGPLPVPAGAKLEDLAALVHFASTPVSPSLALATRNADVPGTVNGGLTLSVGGVSVGTETGDSFNTVCARAGKGLPDLVTAIGTDSRVLAAGALLIAPPGFLPGTAPWKAADAASRFGVSAQALLGANAGTPGLLKPGVALVAAPGNAGFEPIAAHDTLASLLQRFAHRGITSSIDLLVQGNRDTAFLAGGAALLLPAAATLAGNLGPLQDQIYPEPIFAIHAWLQLDRPPALCDPILAADPASAVASARSSLPPVRQDDPQGADHPGSASLLAFAAALETALPKLRVATGKVISELESADPSEIWAAVFSDGGIASVSVSPPLTLAGTDGPQPRTFALRPLANIPASASKVTLKVFDPATGTLSGSETRSFQGVDLEVWAKTFLADVEQILSYKLAPGAYAINAAALQSIALAKKSLASAAAGGLAPVLDIATKEADLRAARDALTQTFLASLTQGYAVSAVLQFNSNVASVWTTDAARLSGVAKIVAPLVDPRPEPAPPSPPAPTPTISNAKISLKNDAAGRVNFILTVPDVARQERVDLNLDYRIVELEFNVRPEIQGYDRSDWIAFVRPLAVDTPPLTIKLGKPTVPLPLRAYPPTAMLLSHDAEGPTDPPDVAHAVKWSYHFRFRHQSAEQDRIQLTVTLNVPRSTLDANLATDDDTLFGKLAQYVAVAEPLRSMLSKLDDWTAITEKPVVQAALDTFEGLATAVAQAWQAHWADPHRDSEAVADAALGVLPVTFPASMKLHSDGIHYLSLTLESDAVGAAFGWPEIAVTTADGTVVRLTPGSVSGVTRQYAFPQPLSVPAHELLSWEFAYPDLPVGRFQNATASVSVDRNAELLEPPAPATNPAFLYQTPASSYGAPVTPFISINDPLNLPRWSNAWNEGPLPALFDTIFDGGSSNRTVAIGVRYGYQLAVGDPPVETYLPVLQSPSMAYVPTTPSAAGTVKNLVEAVTHWIDTAKPVATGGRCVIWIDLHSTIDATLTRPVLQLKRLESPLV